MFESHLCAVTVVTPGEGAIAHEVFRLPIPRECSLIGPCRVLRADHPFLRVARPGARSLEALGSGFL